MKKEKKKVFVIGRKEVVDLPKLGLLEIDAKVDTGAYSSSIHCHNIKIEQKGKKEILHCNFLDPRHTEYNEKAFSFEDFTKTRVKSSNGQVQKRYLIRTEIELFGRMYKTDFTLSDRQEMKYPVLLGRKLLRQGFVVDVSYYNLSHKRKQRNKKT